MHEWVLQPEADEFVSALIDDARSRSEALDQLAGEIETDTATKLVDWIDHLGVPVDEAALAELGWTDATGCGMWRHPEAQVPAITPTSLATIVALRVDDIEQSATALGAEGTVEGAASSMLRRVRIGGVGGVDVVAVERRSFAAGADPTWLSAGERQDTLEARACWAERVIGGDDQVSMHDAIERAGAMVDAVGTDRAAAIVLEHERGRWLASCCAAAQAHGRHARFGLGWGNRDHHTFRSSRSNFAALIRCLEILGFERREQFHAGAEAGWGAQVLEHPGTGEVVFADVDLDPIESGADLAAGLADRPLGPVGTWCAVHGDSFLHAGMHHVAARYDFERYRSRWRDDPGLQDPFSDFDHLRQAFTLPEQWAVEEDRVRRLVAAEALPELWLERLRAGRVPGSHLEIIERRHGFKGFNQHSVSQTIAANDLRAEPVV